MIQLAGTLTTDMVPARRLNAIRNGVNRKAGEDQIVGKFLPTRFTMSIYHEIPGVARKRGKKYEARKLRQVGHVIPNVLTGRLKKDMPSTAKVTATTNGGKVRLRAYWAGKAKAKSDGGFAKQGMQESQRQEFETLSKRETDRMAKSMERDFVQQISKPENRRKRQVRGGA